MASTRVVNSALIALMVVVTSACGESDTERRLSSSAGMPSFPNETVSDLISYADAVVVATVTAEREGSSDVDPGDGNRYIGRVLTFRVDHRVWSAKGAPQPGADFELTTFGWDQRKGGAKKRRLLTDVIWYEKGQQYVIPLSRYEDDSLAIPSVDSIVPVSRTAVFGSGEKWTAATPALAALAFKTPAELTRTLSVARPDPLAAKYHDLNPGLRWRKVVEERASTTSAQAPSR